MPATPLLSVFMPAYNGTKFVPEAIESVIDNGFPELELVWRRPTAPTSSVVRASVSATTTDPESSPTLEATLQLKRCCCFFRPSLIPRSGALNKRIMALFS